MGKVIPGFSKMHPRDIIDLKLRLSQTAKAHLWLLMTMPATIAVRPTTLGQVIGSSKKAAPKKTTRTKERLIKG